MQKIFFSLLSLLSSLVGLYGALRLGWHWEMAVPGALTLLFLGLALVSGNRTYVELLEEYDEDDTPEPARSEGFATPVMELLEVEEPALHPALASPIPATRRGRHHTQRLEWGQVEGMLRSVDGPTGF